MIKLFSFFTVECCAMFLVQQIERLFIKMKAIYSMLISKELDSKFQKNNPIYCSKYSQFVYPDDCKAALGLIMSFMRDVNIH